MEFAFHSDSHSLVYAMFSISTIERPAATSTCSLSQCTNEGLKKRASFGLFLNLSSSFLSTVQKNSLASRIRTQIVIVEVKNIDHYTITTAQCTKDIWELQKSTKA